MKLWEGTVASEGNSQQFFDWYTLSHIEHGFIFFGMGWLLLRRFSVWVWFVLALAIFAELLALAIIRDNRTLNVLMLAYPIEAIRVWQGQ